MERLHIVFMVLVLGCCWVSSTHAHGYLSEPVSRNLYANQLSLFWNHMSGNGGVPGSIPGPCGDNFQGMISNFVADVNFLNNQPWPILATYNQGAELALKVVLTANHGGKFIFRVCPRQTNLDEACFGTNYLTRVDNGQKETWVMTASELFTMRYMLPPTISCDGGCVLQWKYYAMQSCIDAFGCDPTYCGVYANGYNAVYGSNPGWCGTTSGKLEFFHNCADIRILPTGTPNDTTSSPPPPPATPSPSPSPPASCDVSVPTWNKCGGKDNTCPAAAGSCTDAPWPNHCCPQYYSCQRDNEWWWACKPITVSVPAPPPSTPPASPPTSSPPTSPSSPPSSPTTSPPAPPTLPDSNSTEDDYAKVLGYSYLFYEAQQSGVLPSWNRLLYGTRGLYGPGYKKNAHVNDGAVIGKDLSGGWYDAGDQIKCPHPMGWALSNMAFGVFEFWETHRMFGELDTALRGIGWGMDWMVKAHLVASDTPSANEFVGQVSDEGDHSYFGRPEQNPTARPIFKVTAATGGADIVGEYAAAFAAAATLYKQAGNTSYASMLFTHAEQAFAFATTPAYQKNYDLGGWMAYRTYSWEGWKAHVAWAAAWMCKYSSTYCSAAESAWNVARASSSGTSFGYDWDSVLPGAAAVLATVNTGVSAAARDWLENFVMAKWQNTDSRCPATPYSTVCYTQKGVAWYSEWGTLRNNNNAVFLATILGKHGSSAAVRQANMCWARRQMRYTLGSSGSTRSYVIGYGPNWPQFPHHRQAACSATYHEPCSLQNSGTCCAGETIRGSTPCCDSSNFLYGPASPITLYGGLVGGPDQNDYYPDIRNDYKQSEVSVDYNAGLTGAAAGLAYFLSTGDLAVCGAGPGAPSPSSPPPSSPPPSPSTPPPTQSSPSPPPPTAPPPSPPVTPLPPPGTCVTPIGNWEQCGGQSSNCPAGTTCTDAQWPGRCCGSGYFCQRDNAWWWMCVPSPTPPPPPPAPTCGNAVQPWAQCGGKSSSCPSAAGSCTDAPWQNYCCVSGYACVRDGEWWWACKPGATTTSKQTSLVMAATAELSSVMSLASVSTAGSSPVMASLQAQAVDMLVVKGPKSAKAGRTVRLTAALNRQGLPVPGASVFLQVTTTSARGAAVTTTVVCITKANGMCWAAIPVNARGKAGAESVIQAYTADARALGARETVPVVSDRSQLQWRA